jgi:hypothetical protein
MPGLNRRGPVGNGPMTGRKMGRCNPGNKGKNEEEILHERDEQIPAHRFNLRQRLGFGRAKGSGRGFSHGNGPFMRFREK